MNIKRAIVFGLLLYLFAVIASVILFMFSFFSMESVSLSYYIAMWIIYIPLVLILSKWYYKKETPSVKNGFYLGVIAVLVALVFDVLTILGTIAVGESIEMFKEMYSSWMFYATVVEVILLTTLFGGEFDATFSPKA